MATFAIANSEKSWRKTNFYEAFAQHDVFN